MAMEVWAVETKDPDGLVFDGTRIGDSVVKVFDSESQARRWQEALPKMCRKNSRAWSMMEPLTQ